MADYFYVVFLVGAFFAAGLRAGCVAGAFLVADFLLVCFAEAFLPDFFAAGLGDGAVRPGSAVVLPAAFKAAASRDL